MLLYILDLYQKADRFDQCDTPHQLFIRRDMSEILQSKFIRSWNDNYQKQVT